MVDWGQRFLTSLDKSAQPPHEWLEFLRRLQIDLKIGDNSAERLGKSLPVDTVGIPEALRRIGILAALLSPKLAARALSGDPSLLLNDQKQLALFIRLLSKEEMSLDEIQTLLTNTPRILSIGILQFQWSLERLRELIRDPALRRQFLKEYPTFFFLEMDYLEKKTPLPGTVGILEARQHIFFSANGREASYRETPRLHSDANQKARITPPAPSPPKKTQPVATNVPVKRTSPKAGSVPLPRPPSPSVPRAAHPLDTNPALKAIYQQEKDSTVSCRLPQKPHGRSDEPSKPGDPSAIALIEFLLVPRHGIGRDRETITAFVRFRPWLTNPERPAYRLLERLSRLGLRGERLWTAMTIHSGFLALGQQPLLHVLDFLNDNRWITLPDDLSRLAIPEPVFRRRIDLLTKCWVPLTDPRYSTALFADTPKEFWQTIKPPTPP